MPVFAVHRSLRSETLKKKISISSLAVSKIQKSISECFIHNLLCGFVAAACFECLFLEQPVECAAEHWLKRSVVVKNTARCVCQKRDQTSPVEDCG